ncbi:MAG: cytochrome P450 [Dehalococcoidia bacterium]|nr:cytochrome P450 [Dehalococcoidia bacterium]
MNDVELSGAVLDVEPNDQGFIEGELKRSAMAFLAPRALTISHGEEWERRRGFNESVLASGDIEELRAPVLEAVSGEFRTRVGSVDETRERMRAVMRRVVLGDTGKQETVIEIDQLMGVVRSPLRRILFGWRYRGRKRRFYEGLSDAYQSAAEPALAGRARTVGTLPQPEALEQMPHWMFTFTGSGTDLLVRTMALVGSRPAVLGRVRAEIDLAGAEPLAYTEACLLEAGRLFAPVTRTFHQAPEGAYVGTREIAGGMEIAHYFPWQQRDETEDPTANEFRPERWLDDPVGSLEQYPNLFLRGPRSCPGHDLIMFVCQSAMAALLGAGQQISGRSLAADPLPLTFPEQDLRFG